MPERTVSRRELFRELPRSPMVHATVAMAAAYAGIVASSEEMAVAERQVMMPETSRRKWASKTLLAASSESNQVPFNLVAEAHDVLAQSKMLKVDRDKFLKGNARYVWGLFLGMSGILGTLVNALRMSYKEG